MLTLEYGYFNSECVLTRSTDTCTYTEYRQLQAKYWFIRLYGYLYISSILHVVVIETIYGYFHITSVLIDIYGYLYYRRLFIDTGTCITLGTNYRRLITDIRVLTVDAGRADHVHDGFIVRVQLQGLHQGEYVIHVNVDFSVDCDQLERCLNG